MILLEQLATLPATQHSLKTQLVHTLQVQLHLSTIISHYTAQQIKTKHAFCFQRNRQIKPSQTNHAVQFRHTPQTRCHLQRDPNKTLTF